MLIHKPRPKRRQEMRIILKVAPRLLRHQASNKAQSLPADRVREAPIQAEKSPDNLEE